GGIIGPAAGGIIGPAAGGIIGPAAGGIIGPAAGKSLYYNRAHYKAFDLPRFFRVNFSQFTPACFVQSANLHAGVLTFYTPECMI
ncbi:hypothetical protein B5G38_14145, partial [Gemmiger sp. An87]